MLTPQNLAKNLAKTLGLNVPLYLKREDLHPLGSHKGRSIPVMIDRYIEQGVTDFAISSSGNAALAAAHTINKYNSELKKKLKLTIFVGEKIAAEKIMALRAATTDDPQIKIEQVQNPKQQAFQMDKNGEAKLLRQSTDDLALVGYEELANELSQIENLSAVFIPTSSGTTAEGLYVGFQRLKLNPQIHIVQTGACHPMVAGLGEAKTSLASAIVDKVAHRKNEIDLILKNSGGSGWIATDEDILKAQKLVQQTEGIEISPNSALSIVGLMHSLSTGTVFNGPVCCLITGK